MFSRQVVLLVLLTFIPHLANAFDRDLLFKNCEEAQKRIESASIAEKRQLVDFTKNLMTAGNPQLIPALPFSLNAPHVAPLFQKEDMQRAFDHENTQESLNCALKILPLISDYSYELLPKLIENSVLEVLPREVQLQYEKSSLLISQKLSETHSQISEHVTLSIAELLKGMTLPLALLVLKDQSEKVSIVDLFSRPELVDGLLKAFSHMELSGVQDQEFLRDALLRTNEASSRKIFEYIFSHSPSVEFYIQAINNPDLEIRKIATSNISTLKLTERIIFESLTSKYEDVFQATSSFLEKEISSDIELQKDAFNFLSDAEEPYISRTLSILPMKTCGQVIERTPLTSLKLFLHRFAVEKSCNSIFLKKVQSAFSTKKISLSEKDVLTTIAHLLQNKISPKDKEFFKKHINQIPALVNYFLWRMFLKDKPNGWVELALSIPLSFKENVEPFNIVYTKEVGEYFQKLSFDDKKVFISSVKFTPPLKLKYPNRDLLLFTSYGYLLAKKDLVFLSKEKYTCEDLMLFSQAVSQFMSNEKRSQCESNALSRGSLILPSVLPVPNVVDQIVASELPLERKISHLERILEDKSTIEIVFAKLESSFKKELLSKIQSQISAEPRMFKFLSSEISTSHDEMYTFEVMRLLIKLFPSEATVKNQLNEMIKDGSEGVVSLLALLPEQQAGLVILGSLQGASVKTMTLLVKAASKLHSAEQPLLIALKNLAAETSPTREIMFLAQKALAVLTLPDRTEEKILEDQYRRSRFWMEL